MSRILAPVVFLLVATSALLAGCGCGPDRVRSAVVVDPVPIAQEMPVPIMEPDPVYDSAPVIVNGPTIVHRRTVVIPRFRTYIRTFSRPRTLIRSGFGGYSRRSSRRR